MPLDKRDVGYLDQAIKLAERGHGCTSPNPVVGAVVVKDGRVLGEGYHAGPGLDHAEIVAMKNAARGVEEELGSTSEGPSGVDVRDVCAGATIYVTLEPCCTHGRTPPCTTALLEAGFERVVVGAIDPTPEVNGKGLELLRAAGMEVDVADGWLADRAKRQNNGPRKVVATGLPFVTYKYAMTLDGRVASDSGDSRWISSTESRVLVHQWRAWSDAVVVGAGTLEADDPKLTAREVACERQPLRVVVDRLLRLDKNSALVAGSEEGPVLAVCGAEVNKARRVEVEGWGVETADVALGENGELDPCEVGRLLVSRGVQTVLLEGGPRLAGAWWTAGLVDKVAAFVCPRVVSGLENRGPLRGQGSGDMAGATELREVETRQIGPDVLISGYTGEPF